MGKDNNVRQIMTVGVCVFGSIGLRGQSTIVTDGVEGVTIATVLVGRGLVRAEVPI